MTTPVMEVHGLDELLRRMQQFPAELDKSANITMEASLLTLGENVPAYPSPPPNSGYDRTGTLGRTLGSSGGKADIFESKKVGGGFEGRFGTMLEYAPYVIGDDTQAYMHAGRWWTIKDVAAKAAAKIERLWETLGDKMAAFLDRKGL
jgi:hypothetical protein